MDLLFAVTAIIFTLSVVNNLLYAADVLHTSKYKFKLLSPTILEKGLGPKQLTLFILKIIGLLLFIPIAVYDIYAGYYHLVIFGIFLVDLRYFIGNLKNIRIYKSNLTQRELLIGIPTIILLVILFTIPLADYYFWLLLIERLSFMFYFFFALALSFPYEIYEDLQLEKIKKSKNNLKFIFSIVVSGPFSNYTADTLSEILSKNNKNVLLKINVDNLTQLTKELLSFQNRNHNINLFNFQAAEEDIGKILEIIEPQISIISGLNYEKGILSSNILFSNSVNKSQKERIIILNADYEKSKTKLKRLIIRLNKLYNQVILYTYKHDLSEIIAPGKLKIVYCSELKSEGALKYFKLTIKNKSFYFTSAYYDDNYMDTFIPAILTANYLNYSMKEISRIIAKSETKATKIL